MLVNSPINKSALGGSKHQSALGNYAIGGRNTMQDNSTPKPSQSQSDEFETLYLLTGEECLISPQEDDLLDIPWGRHNGYARGRGYHDDRLILMHRIILERVLGRPLKKGELVDHINHNRLDNRRCNLRLADRRENGRNRLPGINNTSGYKGVTLERRKGLWVARLQQKSNGKHTSYNLGYFASKIDAAKQYDRAAIYYFGDFAKTNFPLEEYKNSPPYTPKQRRPRTSQYNGVSFNKASGKWVVILIVETKATYIGTYTSEITAAHAADIAIIAHGLPLKKLNFPNDYAKSLAVQS